MDYKIGDIIKLNKKLRNTLWYQPDLFEIVEVSDSGNIVKINSIENKRVATSISITHIHLDKNTLRLKKLERIIEND